MLLFISIRHKIVVSDEVYISFHFNIILKHNRMSPPKINQMFFFCRNIVTDILLQHPNLMTISLILQFKTIVIRTFFRNFQCDRQQVQTGTH